MKEIEELTSKFMLNEDKLKKDYQEIFKTNQTFKKLAQSLNLSDDYLMKYTSSLEESAKELNQCKRCKNLLGCKNSFQGHVFYPEVLNNNLVFDYIPCKYQKEFDEQNKYKNNIYLFEVPKEIKEASMKEIDTKRIF